MADPIVSVQDATIYQGDLLVLKNISFSLQKGDFAYLIGKTGSGKSSLLKTLYADLPLKSGHAAVAGFTLEKLKSRKVPKLRRKLGIVFQDFQLLSDRSVYDNLKFVMRATGWRKKKQIDEHIQRALEQVMLPTKGHKMPHELSGGEQQRVAIARALINRPEVILADEPTGNLDPETSAGIMQLLRDISQRECAVLVATHDYELIKRFPGKTLLCESERLKSFDSSTQVVNVPPPTEAP